MTTTAGEHYTIVSADCHAGASHEQYRSYLESRYLDDFDAWRGKYRNPFRDLQDGGRVRNWDDERRNGDLERDGQVAEVIFPNTVPPFFPSFVLFVGPPRPDDYEHRLAGIRAHNRWLVDFCGRFPDRRAGIGQIFINDVADAIADVRWIKEHGLRGGVLLPNVAPDCTWVKPLYDPYFDPLWQVCEDLEVPINVHGGTGLPDYGKYPVANLLMITEVGFYSQRPLVQFMLSGIFERFPKLKFCMTEAGGAWVPGLLKNLDRTVDRIRKTGRTGELAYSDEHKLNRLPSEYFAQNVWLGVSQPGPADVAALPDIGVDRFMWGSDYPHAEGTEPYTREHLRLMFHATPEAHLRKVLGGNAANVYGFDLTKLEPLAAQFGPTVAEVREPLAELPDPPNEALLKAFDN